MSIDYTQPLPPYDAVMPAAGQTWLLIIFVLIAIGFFAYAVYLWRKWNNLLPFLFWFGGACSVVVEPIADMALHAIHAPVGQWNAFTGHGFPIPWHIVLAYPSYYGGTLILLWPIIARRTLTRRMAWIIFAASLFWTGLLEQVPITHGIWVYYGPQPFRIGDQPVSMLVANGASVVMTFLIIYKLAPSMNTGWKRFLAIPAVAICALGAHAGSGALMYNVMGLDLEKLGPVFLNMMAVISVGVGVVAVWMTIEITQDKSDTSQPLISGPVGV